MAEKEAKEKPLDKMTVKALREIAKDIPDITGVHGMNKAELLDAVKKAKGIAETPEEKGKISKNKGKIVKKKKAMSVKDIKNKIRAFKAERKVALEAKDKKMATIYRRRISRLKKKTRRAA